VDALTAHDTELRNLRDAAREVLRVWNSNALIVDARDNGEAVKAIEGLQAETQNATCNLDDTPMCKCGHRESVHSFGTCTARGHDGSQFGCERFVPVVEKVAP